MLVEGMMWWSSCQTGKRRGRGEFVECGDGREGVWECSGGGCGVDGGSGGKDGG